MAKAIRDIYGFTQALLEHLGGLHSDRAAIEAVCDRFSENVVIAADSHAVAVQIAAIANEYTGEEGWACPDLLEESPDIDFNRILDKYRDTDQDEVGYTYEALREAVLRVYTESQCVYFTQKSFEDNC
jgi:hypothetical protein